MDKFIFCNNCGHLFKKEEMSDTGCFVCPICLEPYYSTPKYQQSDNVKKDDETPPIMG